jgi:hypothetical protein
MKQYYITSDNLSKDSDDDCYLAPDDPIHELKIGQLMGGLGAEARLAEYKAKQKPINTTNEVSKVELMRQHNIKPGSDEYIKLWFSRPGLTGEKPV